MAKLFRTPRTRLDAAGKRVPETDENGDIIFTSNWHARIEDHRGRRRNFTLSSNKAQAQREAEMIENREREIRMGLRPSPSPLELAAVKQTDEVMGEYFAWGEAQGGRKGHPWARSHSRNKRTILRWWLDVLDAKQLGDMIGCLPRVEKELRTVAVQGLPHDHKGKSQKPLTGKTLQSLSSELKAFFAWCVTRKYLSENPLDDISRFNTEPETIRRALTVEELRRLLDAAPMYMRMLLEVAICTGLRHGELRALTLQHFDAKTMTLRIDADRDKGRILRHQRLPERLVKPLVEFSSSDEVKELYRKFYARKDATSPIPDAPLLFVPTHASRTLKNIADKVGVPWSTDEGKMDFHALRVAYINLVIGTGADVKTTQALARHSTPTMTMNVYGRAVDDRMAKAVEALGDLVIPHPEGGEAFGYSLAILA